MKFLRKAALVTAFVMAAAVTGCSGKEKTEKQQVMILKPAEPVTLTLWHYYNGAQQAAFNSIVDEFNRTAGKEAGVYVEGYSRGSVSDLEKAVRDSLNGEVGAEQMPDIFSSYADTAFSVMQKGALADLCTYLTKEDLSEYVDSYIDEGFFSDDGALYLFPVAKSTEIMMINKTDWEPFAAAEGVTLDDLATIEGVVNTAERYYKWTDAATPDIPDDGKAFYGRDSMSNYFVISLRQMGTEVFDSFNGNTIVNIEKNQIRRLWENYYVPYIKGYFASYGSFRSDDVKTGDIIAYTGSSSSSTYFPDKVELDESSYPIEYIVLDAPIMASGEKFRVQQGAGMAVTKSDESRELAAVIFLKWFTQKEHNLEFVGSSGYLPVRKDANSIEEFDSVIRDKDLKINQKSYDCFKSVMESIGSSNFYTSMTFDNEYKARKVLEYNLSDKASADREEIIKQIESGKSLEEAAASYLTDEAFEEWYGSFSSALKEAAGVS